MKNKSVIIGIGHPFRGDDALGPQAISLLKPHLPPTVDSMTLLGDLSALLSIFENYEAVYLIDAIVTKQSLPGTYHRLEGILPDTASTCRTSTHAFDISQAIEMAHVLNCLPKKLVIFGMEAEQFTEGGPLSNALSSQLPQFINTILNELSQPKEETHHA